MSIPFPTFVKDIFITIAQVKTQSTELNYWLATLLQDMITPLTKNNKSSVRNSRDYKNTFKKCWI